MTRPTFSRQFAIALSTALTISLNFWGGGALAGDPFRQSNPRNIGDKTEAAFEAIFLQGNYLEAKQRVTEAEKSEAGDPLVYAMKASLAFDEENFEAMKVANDQTLAAAEKLKGKDPLRGNLYLAVGNFLEGVYIFKTQGPVGAVPKLQQVLQYLDTAEKISPNDPELNLLKGYLELILSVNLPFSSPEQAIERFEKYAAPDYMVNRGIATAYRDLYKQKMKAKQYDGAQQYLVKANQYLDKALQESPGNPELQYLKGQFLLTQGKDSKNLSLVKQSIPYFEKAKQKEAQLPRTVKISLNHDYNNVVPEQIQLLSNEK
jgi:tetratricopeptide (TPR) repeat protein